MIIPDNLLEERTISLGDQFFDLKGLSAYAAIGIATLRDHIKKDGLPCFRVKGKILIKKSEYNEWLERYRVNRNQDLNEIADEVIKNLRTLKSDN